VQIKAASRGVVARLKAGLTTTTREVIVMATTSLSPKRELERIRKHRSAVITLAMQQAKRLVQRQLQAQGLKLAQFSAKEITLLAEAELERNRARFIAVAEQTINTWPGFARLRLPPELAAESVRKVQELRTLAQQQPRQCEENWR
jgi:hypothetical protein